MKQTNLTTVINRHGRTRRLAQVTGLALTAAACSALAVFSTAHAQVSVSDEYVEPKRDFRSPVSGAFELRIGPYVPDVGDGKTFEKYFPSDNGLLLGLEIDYLVLRLDEIVAVGPGIGFGYTNYSGKAYNSETGERTDESGDLTMFPLSILAVVRVDVLARKLGVPLIVAGKLGYRWSIWDTDKGGSDDENGVSPSFTWAVQGDIDLDFFDSRAARLLDEEWGINHTFLFFELFGSKNTGDGLKLDDTTWCAGLGFIF